MKRYAEYKKYTDGTWQKHLYDLSNLPLKDFLVKYHRNIDKPTLQEWQKWMDNFVIPAFDSGRYCEMIKNFGYSSKDKHDFKKQNIFFQILRKDDRLDDETRKFIAFMAGNHFFDKYNLTINEWFNSLYWTRPDLKGGKYTDYKDDYTINQILNLPYGLNHFKNVLLNLNHWHRI
ncbi:hypothetical protein [Sediminitomix flava]|uniref:Uncharacterized protein n=1 Tax=Sediminitomix flava TaxID=379075 RepID=A0A315ZDA4_SEDFL|nr:hypothetical protein [Sediminitomix flava]PWJ42694.1 hypothetical protein BC781_102239 [Sediminitomix flava]